VLIDQGFNPKFFTHYWKNNKGDVYLFCYEYGFNPKYALENLFRTETTSKQIVTLTYLNSP